MHETQRQSPFDNNGTKSVDQADLSRSSNTENNNNNLIVDNLKGDDDSDGMDQSDEMIGQQIVFTSDDVSVEGNDEVRGSTQHRQPLHAIVPSPSSLIYVKRDIRQYDMEEGKTFRRQQQRQSTKSTTSIQHPRVSTRTYGNCFTSVKQFYFLDMVIAT